MIFGEKDIDMSDVEISGRYPDGGRVVNEVCKELIFVQNGSGKIVIEGEEISLEKGDQALINPGEKYFYDGKNDIICILCASLVSGTA